ncbi:MBL fold metallo-hydrolase [Rossellomorea vietnamensis]|uniref:MBL fold metallo-hydrolase n=2 Tax=Rossellomorea TaxID=2837508 RepID=A0A5D4KK78_9BACI|nr:MULTISPECIES: MBL fold metallo-hydrolase [Rossellomorea]TYR77704.1 MBL fold metallo-hydrolase [Rossellomorea vietnamensis]TYS83463.1 MBL fold metallo-hydrolase [Rossellomorea aquimaris]
MIINSEDRISIIDLFDLNERFRTGAYIIKEEEVTVIETSASPSIPRLIEGLEQMGISLDRIKNIIVTHIHLDHAGGAGLFLEKCRNASIIVHEKGARHLINPEKLEAGARQVYGKDFDRLFHPITPVPPERVIIKKHNEQLPLSPDSTLTFFDTPGHSRHHFSIYDNKSKGIFTGDTAGINYGYTLEGEALYLPSTSPNQFNPEEMIQSLALYSELELDRIYFGHFGISEEPAKVLTEIKKWLKIFMDTAIRITKENKPETQLPALTEALKKEVLNSDDRLRGNEDFLRLLDLDMKVSAMGLIDYLNKTQSKKEV